MTKTKNALFALPVLAAILVGGTISPAFAGVDGTFICDGTIIEQTIDANVIVPEGESCSLGFNAVINGNVTVQKNAEFTIFEQAFINGNLMARGSGDIDITELNMVGNISIINSGEVSINQATNIQGSVKLIGNESVLLFEQSISDDVSIIQNGDVSIGDIGMNNLKMIGNGIVTAGEDDFGVGVRGNATCQQNESITGEFFVNGNNNGCPAP